VVDAFYCDTIFCATDSPGNQAKTVLQMDEYKHNYKIILSKTITAWLRILKLDFFLLPG